MAFPDREKVDQISIFKIGVKQLASAWQVSALEIRKRAVLLGISESSTPIQDVPLQDVPRLFVSISLDYPDAQPFFDFPPIEKPKVGLTLLKRPKEQKSSLQPRSQRRTSFPRMPSDTFEWSEVSMDSTIEYGQFDFRNSRGRPTRKEADKFSEYNAETSVVSATDSQGVLRRILQDQASDKVNDYIERWRKAGRDQQILDHVGFIVAEFKRNLFNWYPMVKRVNGIEAGTEPEGDTEFDLVGEVAWIFARETSVWRKFLEPRFSEDEQWELHGYFESRGEKPAARQLRDKFIESLRKI